MDRTSELGLAPAERKARIVRLMCEGHGDHLVAARIGVSVRTVRRDIAEMMTLHGAPNRFVLGARLAESGWQVVATQPAARS